MLLRAKASAMFLQAGESAKRKRAQRTGGSASASVPTKDHVSRVSANFEYSARFFLHWFTQWTGRPKIEDMVGSF